MVSIPLVQNLINHSKIAARRKDSDSYTEVIKGILRNPLVYSTFILEFLSLFIWNPLNALEEHKVKVIECGGGGGPRTDIAACCGVAAFK